MKSKYVTLILVSLLVSGLAFAYIVYLPKIEAFALKEVNQAASNSNVVDLKAEALSINPILLKASINDLQINPKGDLKKTLSSLTLKRVAARISFLGLLRGQVRLAKVEASQARAQLIIDTTAKSSKPIEIPLKQIFRLPIDEIQLEDITLLGRIDPQKTVFKLEDFSLKLENRYNSLWIDLSAPSAFMKPAGPFNPIQFQVDARGLVEEDQIRLTALKVKRNDSYLISSGFFWGDISKAKITSSEMASKLLVNLSSLKDWVAAFQPERKIPYMEGIANLSSTSGFKDKVPYLNLKLDGEGIVFDRYNIGNVRMNGTLEKSAIKSLEGEIQNSSGKLLLQNFSMNLDGDYDLKVKASPNVEVSQFLHSIGLPKIPLKAQLSGTVQCEGKLKEKLLLNCEQAQAQVRGFHLFAPKDRKTIVKFQKAEATGSFTVTDKEVTYKAQLKMGEQSKGQSEGTIGYKEGFVISYSTEEFHFSDLESLSDLKLSGVGKIEGETRGNSDSATMTLKGSFEDFWLDDYALGKINSRVIYDKGFLHFKETNGLYGNTRYSGHLSLNLPESQIYVYLKSPYLELPDVKGILQKRLPIPVDVAGTGNADFKGYGPLDITKMNYEVNADVFRGSVAGESFESINAKLRAREGVLSTEDLKIKKGSGLISFSGTLTPSWTINMTAAARDLRLEQSDRFAELGLDIQGGCNINTRVTGDLKNPTVELSGQTLNMHAGNFPVNDSNFSMIFKDKSLSGNANLLGSKIQTSFILPLTEEGEFSLKANTKDLNISALFEAVSKARQTYDFETKASFDVDLYAKQGGFWKSTGLIDIGNFSIRRGGESLTSDGPMKVIMTQGVMNTENFGLSGENSYLKLEVRSSTKDRINGRLNGKLDLNILSPFVTFASEIRGILSLNTSFLGSVNDLNVSGSAYLDQGYIKANAFPHPFSEIRADMLFNQKSLFINSFQGSVADGKINGSGRAQYESPQSIPVQIDGHMKEVSINFPEGYFTKGSAQFSLSGQKFPYLFKIDYNVEHANIVSEFGGGSKDAEVRKSPYLPPSIAKATNEPFRMDLNLNFLSPIKISNSLLDASIKGDLRIEGDAQALVFSGGLTPIPGGTVFFRDVPFEITTGYIQYDNVAPDNAKLYLAATARVGEVTASQDKRQVERQFDVTMIVQGRANNPQLLLSSQPPLPQKDIVSLLALGLTQEALDNSRTSGLQVTSTSTTALGAALLQKPVGKKLKDNFGVDMKVTSSQSSPDVASAAKVTFTKQWTPKLSISASGTIKANPESSVKMEYEMKRGLSVIGFWEGKDQGANLNEDSKETDNSVIGLDLEYRVQFK